jgi:ABC-type bacteriocin/lantibiotic exporter with double-glycine peptidase domain
MRRASRSAGRRFLAPEVVQTSVMDCGPAALTCLLKGFRISASYARLQEACQTDLDGTSINTIEQVAIALGLDAEQIMVPVDHLLLSSARALPALVVVRRDGMTHFLIAWRRHGPFVQLMDPAKGRRWLREDAFRAELFVHLQKVPAAAWREFAQSEEFLGSLTERLHGLRVPGRVGDRLARAASDDQGWRGFATLDASARLVADLVAVRGLRPGREAGRVIETMTRRAGASANPFDVVPATYWSVLPDADAADSDQVILRGAVLLRVCGQPPAARAETESIASPPAHAKLVGDLGRAVAEAPCSPLNETWGFVRRGGAVAHGLLIAALVLAAAGAVFEMLLLRAVLEISGILTLHEHRLMAVGLLLAFVATLLILEVALSGGVLRMGRRLEARFRAALLDKLPRLGDRYFRSRLVSDMAHRAHSLDALRALPDLGARFTRTAMQLIFTALGLAWLDLPSVWAALLAAGCAIAIPIAAERMVAERDLRQRSHSAALSRHYLDSLLGLVAARTHGAERALRRRHESLLVEWGRSSLHLLRGIVVIEGLQLLVGSSLAAWLVLGYVGRGGRPGGALLLVYWALNLPMLGKEVAAIVRQFPAYRNILMRALEPMRAPDEVTPRQGASPESTETAAAVTFDGVHVQLGGRRVLSGVNLTIRPREHVAIVGRSGAGKSTLVGLLLGWLPPTAGRVIVDDAPLDGEHLAELRRRTAWVDPSIHLWNRSLFDNLRYGDAGSIIASIGSVIETAELTDILEKLPGGLQSRLGEGGGLTSGGEGQRVRFGRALVRHPARLAILDEPFRGLDRSRRHELLTRARERWRETTLLCVTHDIDETLAFDRVLVVDGGRIVEDGDPAELARSSGSIFAALLSAETIVKNDLWSSGRWRRWRLDEGSITERPTPERSFGPDGASQAEAS